MGLLRRPIKGFYKKIMSINLRKLKIFRALLVTGSTPTASYNEKLDFGPGTLLGPFISILHFKAQQRNNGPGLSVLTFVRLENIHSNNLCDKPIIFIKILI